MKIPTSGGVFIPRTLASKINILLEVRGMKTPPLVGKS